MRILVRGPPQHSAEATRIVEADEFAAVEHKIDVVVLDQRMRGVEHEHAAAHAEMPDHAVVRIERDDQILAAPRNRLKDRKSDVSGKGGSVRVDPGGRRIINTKVNI